MECTRKKNLEYLQNELLLINKRLGLNIYTFDMPDGGWYLPLKVNRKLLPFASSSVELCYLLAAYAEKRESGVAALPGELFGYRFDTETEYFTMRLNIANDEAFLTELIIRLEDFGKYALSDMGRLLMTRQLDELHVNMPGLKHTLETQQF